MKYVYLVIGAGGFIFGVYASQADAQKVFDALAADNDGLRLSTEPVINKAAHFPQTMAELEAERPADFRNN